MSANASLKELPNSSTTVIQRERESEGKQLDDDNDEEEFMVIPTTSSGKEAEKEESKVVTESVPRSSEDIAADGMYIAEADTIGESKMESTQRSNDNNNNNDDVLSYGLMSRVQSVTLLPSESAASLRSKAESLTNSLEEIDFRTFCLLSQRLMIVMEQ